MLSLHVTLFLRHEVFESATTLHLVMELCAGGNLGEYINRHPDGALTEKRARPLASKMLRAIAYLHANHISHRDIKVGAVATTPTQLCYTFNSVAVSRDCL